MVMNKIDAKIVSIKESGDLCHLFLNSDVGELGLVMLGHKFSKGDDIEACFKETAVAILKADIDKLSYSNKIEVEIKSIEFGDILTSVVGVNGRYEITSIITTNSAKKLELKVADRVYFLIKATDMFVM